MASSSAVVEFSAAWMMIGPVNGASAGNPCEGEFAPALMRVGVARRAHTCGNGGGRGENDDQQGAMARVRRTAGSPPAGGEPRCLLPPRPQRAGNAEHKGLPSISAFLSFGRVIHLGCFLGAGNPRRHGKFSLLWLAGSLYFNLIKGKEKNSPLCILFSLSLFSATSFSTELSQSFSSLYFFW